MIAPQSGQDGASSWLTKVRAVGAGGAAVCLDAPPSNSVGDAGPSLSPGRCRCPGGGPAGTVGTVVGSNGVTVSAASGHMAEGATWSGETAARSMIPSASRSSFGRKREPSQPEDVVDDRLGDGDLRVAGEARWLEAKVGELGHEVAERHAVLEGQADRRRQRVHEAGDRGALLGHLDEDLAGLAVRVEADRDVALVAGDLELVRDGCRSRGSRWRCGLPASSRAAASPAGSSAIVRWASSSAAAAVAADPTGFFFPVESGCDRFEPSR